MSTIRKIPFIESVISALTTAELNTLINVINNGGNNTSCSASTVPDGIVGVHFNFYNGRVMDGIAIKKATLITYDSLQTLKLFKISEGTVSQVNEYCDINELRRLLKDYGATTPTAWESALSEHMEYSESADTINADEITVDNVFIKEELEFENTSADFGTNAKAKIVDAVGVDATSQDSGKVLTADGSGGKSWVYPSASNFNSGSATSGQVLKANGSSGASWGDITIPTVDQTYNASSTNAQSGTAVASAISGKQNTISASNKVSADYIQNGSTYIMIPALPSDASTKTYTLQAVNGVLTWVETTWSN